MAGGQRTDVTWNIANTNSAPVSAATVDSLLSADGGATWSTVLASGTPNDGAETVVVPALETGAARRMVRALSNSFVAIETRALR